MACQCKQIFGDEFDLVPTCIGNVWIFEDLSTEEKQALAACAMVIDRLAKEYKRRIKNKEDWARTTFTLSQTTHFVED